MLTDWTYWLSCKHPEQVLSCLIALLLTDGPRYALGKLAICLYDWGADIWRWVRGRSGQHGFTYCPSVCVVIAGHNEAETIEGTLSSLWGTYPRLEIIVVDDGSTDGMAAAARRFARDHEGILVLSRPERGGKSSAMNFALPYTRAEAVVVVDADSSLGPNGIWEIVQPLEDQRVGAVAGSVLSRNPFTNLVTWLQAYEYLSCIFVGRLLCARLGILGIISGAFGVFRRAALDSVMGWDVGPPEDLDLTLSLRKAGYRIAFAQHAICFTDVPESWWVLIKQRLRWERSGTIRNHCRKHLDMAFFWQRHFRPGDFALLVENWFFNVISMYAIWVWFIAFCLFPPPGWWQILVMLYLCYIVFELLQVLAVCLYSNSLGRDLLICAVFMLVPAYQLVLLAVRLMATTEEIFLRKSFQDNYVPLRVREATWHW